ncbi:hypothetical protein GJ496_008185 [Pomphorhynchus laevis]|nr:hypothetical protein GJ496_008185 [Pomphorhynchus laevis]
MVIDSKPTKGCDGILEPPANQNQSIKLPDIEKSHGNRYAPSDLLQLPENSSTYIVSHRERAFLIVIICELSAVNSLHRLNDDLDVIIP